jgi:GH25 family lysozyme M1 (1,4-beta-N-acetylmuramidase)
MTLGIDVYRYQTVTDWNAVRRTVDFVWVKVSDGGGPAVVKGDAQVNGAKSVGLPVGGYHYAQLDPSPEQQADVLLAEVDRLAARGLVPMLDIEAPFQPDQGARVFAERFCNHIAARTGRRPGVYMNNAFAKVLRPDTWPVNPVIWIARYGARPDYGGRYDIHQYADNGTVPGISGAVDLNESYTNAHHATGGSDVELHTTYTDWAGNTQTVQGTYDRWDQKINALYEALVHKVPSRVDPMTTLQPLAMLPYIDEYTHDTAMTVQRLEASIAGLTAAVAALSADEDLTRDEVATIVRDAVRQSIEITGTVQITGKETPDV